MRKLQARKRSPRRSSRACSIVLRRSSAPVPAVGL